MFILKATLEQVVENSIGFYCTYEWKGFPDGHYPVVLFNYGTTQEFNVICTPAQLELCEFMACGTQTIYVLSKKIINEFSKNRFTTYLKKEQAHKCDMEIPETLVENALGKLDRSIGVFIDLKDKHGTCNIQNVAHMFPPGHVRIFTTSFRTFLAMQPETRKWTEFQINYCWDLVLEKAVEKAKTYQAEHVHPHKHVNSFVSAFVKGFFGGSDQRTLSQD